MIFKYLQKNTLPFLKRIFQYKAVRIISYGLLLFIALDLIFPFKVQPNYSTLITDSEGKVLHAFLNNQDKWRMKTELSEITPTLEKAIVYKEDRWFRWHFGVNPFAIMRAGVRNVFTGRRTSGASTITMQVVRLLNPKSRTYFNKIIEILRAFQLEVHYSKDEILQLYLNLVPYGSNIEGIKSASILYFQKSPDVLSLAEVMALAIIPNRPSSLRLGINNDFILKERNRWLEEFKIDQVFHNQDIDDALSEPLNVQRHEAPKLAPHLSLRLKQENPTEANIHSSLIRNKQLTIEKIVQNYVSRLYAMNIHNAAVMVINNQTHQVEAYIGSADFNNPVDGGQVDGVRAIRSPGSTLKPLLYATAFDKGIITPKSMINDVPTNFGGFEPENFDKLFHGKVSVEFALANSLNIPAVKLLKEITTPVLVDKLKKADFQAVKKNSSKLGLSLVLGGCGVTLEELTNLFSSFANEGRFQKAFYLTRSVGRPQPPLRWRGGVSGRLSPSPTERGLGATDASGEVCSKESTYLINQILTQITRPDLPNNYAYTYRMPKIAWKTGTSFGKKDAWSIGYNAKYTVGVWIGNFSGEGVPELSGANIATPLLFDIFNTIDYNSSSKWFKSPENITLRKVCAESGDVPNEFCINQVTDYYIPSVSKMTQCTHARYVYVSADASMSYCSHCMPDSGAVKKIFPNHAPELVSWFETKHILYERVPTHNPKCERVFAENAPQIVYPVDGSEYILDKNDTQKLMLNAQVRNDVKEIYWYINDKLLQKATPNTPIFFEPTAGKIKISCSDDKGRNTDIFVKVRWE
jgi:penicillin-binding protein 1C